MVNNSRNTKTGDDVKKHWMLLIVLFVITIFTFSLMYNNGYAQSYSFQLEQEVVHVFMNETGTISVEYQFTFLNDKWASPIDYVDIGIPNNHFQLSNISASINNQPITDIQYSPYVKPGVALGLSGRAIQPGETGIVYVQILDIEQVFYVDSQDKTYASLVFSPTWFGKEYINGTTNLTVNFHFPPGVHPDQPKWHNAPSGFISEPITGFGQNNRIVYTWNNPNAYGFESYVFGASFPQEYIPASSIVKESIWDQIGKALDPILPCLFPCGFTIIIGIFSILGYRNSQRRKLQYLPPKIAIQGQGIKRGLTAIEAAILLEQPLDKVLTAILFSVIKKGAATVLSQNPLKLKISDPIPDDLRQYEQKFIDAFKNTKPAAQKKLLQDMIVDLVKSVSTKMKGFSRKETINYYQNIVNKAWAQVEAEETPDIRLKLFDENMEWTMMDRDYTDRTRKVFEGKTIYAPLWWHRYNPNFNPLQTNQKSPSTLPTLTTGKTALPHLPGADFAANVVQGVQNFSGGIIGNLSEFTSQVTNKTNPIPASTSRGSYRSGGGGGCACACACAGCACACAGGGR